MCNDRKFLIWAAIVILGIILFITAALKEGEVREKMRPDTYQAQRFPSYNKS